MPFDSRRGARIRTGRPLLPKQSPKHANHGKKPSNSLMDCTICRSCRFDVRHPAGVPQRELLREFYKRRSPRQRSGEGSGELIV